jgi:DNA polymerase-3 subunit epsilon
VEVQRPPDDLGTPLHDVTFCVLDLETTGASPADCAITEIGAVKLRGGERVGTFQTLVNPGAPIPPFITVLTGITEAMVMPAPRVEQVLPTFLSFLAGTVVVGHNVGFDVSFLRADMTAHGHDPSELPAAVVDTCALARRLLRDEAPDCRLATLASRFRLTHRPCHRALEDALATGDLLHLLLEQAGGLGVLALDDLLGLPQVVGHPQLDKLRLTDGLPRAPGVYLFRDRRGRVLHVGRAANLRQRVRSSFWSDRRSRIGQLLRETVAIDHVVCATPLEAAVLEVRLVHEHAPRFNRRATQRRPAYVKLTLEERFPRLSVVRAPRADDGCPYLGPLPSHAAAGLVVEAIQQAAPIRRCTARPGARLLAAPCAPARRGGATCPCSGQVGAAEYAAVVERVRRGLTSEPGLLLEPLRRRIESLAAAERFEEAAEARDRAAALATALDSQRRLDGLRRAGRIVVHIDGAGAVALDGGLWAGGRAAPADRPPTTGAGPSRPLNPATADELTCVAAWLDANAHRVRVLACEGELASPLPALPTFAPAGRWL